jgi:superfamily II DNA helicase RecQ
MHVPVFETATSVKPAKMEEDPNPELHEYLREWRRRVAKERGVAAFVVLHDTSRQEICRRQPGTLTEIRQIHGFGERKTETYGQSVLDALAQFRSGARASAAQ